MKWNGNLQNSPSALPNFTFTTRETVMENIVLLGPWRKTFIFMKTVWWKYLDPLPKSNAHHHQSGNLLQSQDPERTRGPGDHPYHQTDNHHHALKITPISSQHILYTITFLINVVYPDFYNTSEKSVTTCWDSFTSESSVVFVCYVLFFFGFIGRTEIQPLDKNLSWSKTSKVLEKVIILWFLWTVHVPS